MAPRGLPCRPATPFIEMSTNYRKFRAIHAANRTSESRNEVRGDRDRSGVRQRDIPEKETRFA